MCLFGLYLSDLLPSELLPSDLPLSVVCAWLPISILSETELQLVKWRGQMRRRDRQASFLPGCWLCCWFMILSG